MNKVMVTRAMRMYCIVRSGIHHAWVEEQNGELDVDRHKEMMNEGWFNEFPHIRVKGCTPIQVAMSLGADICHYIKSGQPRGRYNSWPALGQEKTADERRTE